jgi:ankyrin repeat protein
LAEAARINDVEKVTEIVAGKASVDDPLAIALAAEAGHKEIVAILVESGTNPDETYAPHPPPLISAIMGNHADVVHVLLDGGANPDVRFGQDGNALTLAADNANDEIVRLLLQAGANPNAISRGGQTPLFAAVFKRDRVVLDTLLAHQADPNIGDYIGRTPLMFAAKMNEVPILKSLIASGANLDTTTNPETALIAAACNESEEAIAVLLEAGAEPNVKAKWGKFPLMCAASTRSTSIAEKLIRAGADVNLQDGDGKTALMEAVRKDDLQMVRLLLDKGATPDLARFDGADALQIAELYRHQSIVWELNRAMRGKNAPLTPKEPLLPEQPSGYFATVTGTGWLARDGYIVTNHHVVVGHRELLVRFNSIGETVYPARVVLADPTNDLAILELIGENRPVVAGIPISAGLPKLGEEVFTIGYPKTSIMGKNPKVTDGIISSLSGFLDDPRILQTTVAIQSGNSGGPLLNLRGEAVGVTTATLRAQVYEDGLDIPQSVNYAVKSAYVSALLSGLPNKTHSQATSRRTATIADLIPGLQDSIVQVIVSK